MQNQAASPSFKRPVADRLVHGFAILRGLMIFLFSIALIVVPEKVVPGSSSEPALTLALTFSSRSLLLGLAFIIFAMRGKRQLLAWIFVGDALLQIFDTGMAIRTDKGFLAAVPMAIGLLDMWSGLYLRRVNGDEAQ